MAAHYQLNPNHPVKGEGRVPVLHVPTLLSDVNKIAWTRAFLGWAYRCVVTKDPKRAMAPHSHLVHFLLEMYASQGVPVAKLLSECGQGIPVYAAGTEVRTGTEGLMTSDWGNKTFVQAGKKVASGIFVGCGDNESDKRDRIESLRSNSLQMAWTGYTGKERTADALVVAMEWMCYKISEKELIDCLLDSAWPCAIAVLRTLQMCEPSDTSVLQMPKVWCDAQVGWQFAVHADLELCLSYDHRKGLRLYLHKDLDRWRDQEAGLSECAGPPLRKGQTGSG